MTTRRFNRFADWCRHKDDLSPEARHTVEMLLKRAGTSDGEEAERILSSRTSRLDLYSISDLTPLSSLSTLTNLTWLNLFENQIGDITPLSGLTNLTRLELHNNQISDISPLSPLTNLTFLSLSDNQISDITPLSGLTHLTCLYLEENQISNITPLSPLTHLTTLALRYNQITDITPLSPLTELDELNLYNNQISDITPLSDLKNLTTLHLEENQISDVTPLSDLKNLTTLKLHNNQISDITPLSDLKNLTTLHLSGNQISDITLLATLTHLTEMLELYANQINDITPLSTLTHLTYLNLEDNQINDITPLSMLTHLSELHLSSNQISDITPLATLTHLRELHLSSNQISDTTPLSMLTHLRELHLSSNQINDITPLATLTHLRELHLNNNPIPNLNLLKVLQQQWCNLSTEPTAHQPATVAVQSAYATIDFAEPEILFASSPYAALASLGGCESLGEPLAYELSEATKKLLSFGLWRWLREQMEFQLGWEVQGQLDQQLRDDGMEMQGYISPEDMVELISITQFYVSQFGCVLDHKEQQTLWCLKLLFSSCGWIFPFEKVCVVCDRPRILCFDNQERLHAEGAPAVQFADGWSIYAYHGVRLPEKYGKVHPNQWQAQWLLEEKNAELRRTLIQGIGYDRIFQELQAIELDTWQEYTLIKIDADADEEPIYLCKNELSQHGVYSCDTSPTGYEFRA